MASVETIHKFLIDPLLKLCKEPPAQDFEFFLDQCIEKLGHLTAEQLKSGFDEIVMARRVWTFPTIGEMLAACTDADTTQDGQVLIKANEPDRWDAWLDYYRAHHPGIVELMKKSHAWRVSGKMPPRGKLDS